MIGTRFGLSPVAILAMEPFELLVLEAAYTASVESERRANRPKK